MPILWVIFRNITEIPLIGYWFEPGHKEAGPGLLEDKRLPLRRLYSYRIKSDYEGAPIDEHHLGGLLETVKQIIEIVEEQRR